MLAEESCLIRSSHKKGSKRQALLVAASLWAAQSITQTASSSFAFDRHTDNQQCRANSAPIWDD